MSIDYTIVFEEPWRVGSGEAAGWILDAGVRRDPDGLPFVPGSTLRGLLGDALRKLAPLLGLELCDGTLAPPPPNPKNRPADDSDAKGGSGEEPSERPLGKLCGVNHGSSGDGSIRYCAYCTLLGSPRREGAISWGPARLRGGDRAEKKGLASLAAELPGYLVRRRNRTSIDAQSGRAEDEHLFTLEEARGNLELGARLEFRHPLGRDHLALLVAAMRHIRELGGGRRRGLGSCRLRIETPHLRPVFEHWREAVAHLEALDSATLGEADKAVFPGTAARGEPAILLRPLPTATKRGTVRPIALELNARVVGEVALGGRPESGNLVSGLPFLPGSTLRGAVAARWRHDKDSEVFLRCFVTGDLRFGYLHPLEGQCAAQPTPLSAHTCKLRPGRYEDGGHGIFDTLANPGLERCCHPGCKARLVPWRPSFEGRAAPLDLSSHNRIDPKLQSVRQGSLFAYETLGHGARLRGFVVADQAEDLDRLLAGLGLGSLEALSDRSPRLRLRVGRRKGALGHLDCKISLPSTATGDVGLFPDAAVAPDPPSGPCDVRIDLLTPAILVDDHLRYRDLEPKDLGLERPFDGAMSRRERVAGWHGMHALPKTEELAVSAGSCWLLRQAREHELTALRKAAWQGVGRRLAEGFGAVAITQSKDTAGEKEPS